MIFVLFSLCLCERISDFICFGERNACNDYIAKIDYDAPFKIENIENIQKILSNISPYASVIIATEVSISVMMDFRSTSSSFVDLYLMGINQMANVSIRLPNNIPISSIRLMNINATIELDTKDLIRITRFEIVESSLIIDNNFEINYVSIDSYSVLSGSFTLRVAKQLIADIITNIEKFNISPEAKVIKLFGSKIKSVKITETSFYLYDTKDKFISSIEINSNLTYSSNGLLVTTFLMIYPLNSIEHYTKIHFAANTKGIRFNGTFPGDIETKDYMFFFEKGSDIIYNSSYVPVSFQDGCHLYFETKEYTLSAEQRILNENNIQYDNFGVYIHSHENFKDKRITIRINKNKDYTIDSQSPNIDFIFNSFNPNSNNNFGCFDEKSINTFTFLNSISYGTFNLIIRAQLPAFFNDSSLKIYEEGKLIIECNYTPFNAINFTEFPNDANDVSEIFSFESKNELNRTTVYFKKIDKVPIFMPNIEICDNECLHNEYLWFKPNNISNLYEYLLPSYNKSIIITSTDFLPNKCINFTRFPICEELFTYLNIYSDKHNLEIPVEGYLKIYKLNLINIRLKPVAKTNYSLIMISLAKNSSIFEKDAIYDEKIEVYSDSLSLDNVPSKVINIYYIFNDNDKYLVTKNSNMIFNSKYNVKVNLSSKNINFDLRFRYIFILEGNESITSWNFNPMIFVGHADSLVLAFEGNWSNCLVDFFDFSKGNI